MVQLQVQAGSQAGLQWAARHFPVRIGRATDNDLSLDDDGVWDRHLEIAVPSSDGFLLQSHPDALTYVNGQPVRETVLRNGDLIQLGSVQLRFWLVASRQYSLRFREAATWVALGLLCACQIGLIYWLLG